MRLQVPCLLQLSNSYVCMHGPLCMYCVVCVKAMHRQSGLPTSALSVAVDKLIWVCAWIPLVCTSVWCVSKPCSDSRAFTGLYSLSPRVWISLSLGNRAPWQLCVGLNPLWLAVNVLCKTFNDSHKGSGNGVNRSPLAYPH